MVRAVKLMYAAAGLEVVALIIAVITRSSLRSAIIKAHPAYTSAQVNTAETSRTTILIVGAVIAVGLWLWMAWADGKGKNWARILSAVFFGISTLTLLTSVITARAVADLIAGVVIWLIGLTVIVLLFNKESAPFFR